MAAEEEVVMISQCCAVRIARFAYLTATARFCSLPNYSRGFEIRSSTLNEGKGYWIRNCFWKWSAGVCQSWQAIISASFKIEIPEKRGPNIESYAIFLIRVQTKEMISNSRSSLAQTSLATSTGISFPFLFQNSHRPFRLKTKTSPDPHSPPIIIIFLAGRVQASLLLSTRCSQWPETRNAVGEVSPRLTQLDNPENRHPA